MRRMREIRVCGCHIPSPVRRFDLCLVVIEARKVERARIEISRRGIGKQGNCTTSTG